MDTVAIKMDLFRKIDYLQGNKLKDVYGILLNFLNSKNSVSDWDNLSAEQQEALKLGINQLENGEGVSHTEMMKMFREKYEIK